MNSAVTYVADRTRSQSKVRRIAMVSIVGLLGLSPGLLLAGPAAGVVGVAPTTVTVAGDLQSEVGCTGDWQPDCAASSLDNVPGTSTWQRDLQLPAGAYQYKITINGGWGENYGAGGVASGANIPLSIAGAVHLLFSYDADTHLVSVTPQDLPGAGVGALDRGLASRSSRNDLSRERFYFVMTDRFANGSTANDLGGYPDAKSAGFDPTGKAWYHGGDLLGITQKLDYIKGLGTTAIWLTPSFKNKPVQDNNGYPSGGYHGYWITDFTQIDPHLGTNAELKTLIAKAHAKGMKVFFDIITNHTADVIDYAQKKYDYIDKATSPYRDAAGTVFDDKAYAGTSSFPTLDPATSFPYTPIFDTPADASVKVPAWLNDVTLYHNRGNSTFAGESSEYGDFAGLDDLFTENPAVVSGMTDIYKAWVDFGVDGFRIDTTKHVNIEFWQSFIPAIRAEAGAVGTKKFFAFGEVFDGDPRLTSRYVTEGKLQATLDFPFQAKAQGFATGKETAQVRDVLAADDWYTDADGNAYALPTFLGNHDMGRIGYFLQSGLPGASASELLQRDELAHSLMYLSRGNPVVYYGDEQGFTGDGGDQDARQDMFPSQVASYNNDVLIGSTSTTAADNFDPTHPLYRWISTLAALRQANPALSDGAQIHRYASGKPGIYAFSRIDRASGREYVVALNNALSAQTATFSTYGAGIRFAALFGASANLRSDAQGRVTVTVPALSASVWRATEVPDAAGSVARVTWLSPTPGAVISALPSASPGAGRTELRVASTQDAAAEVSFAWRVAGASTWTTLGTDDSVPYRVMPDTKGLAKGSLIELRAVLRDAEGRLSASSSFGVLGDPSGGSSGGGAIPPVIQPNQVSVPGNLNSEMGCGGDWDPACTQAQLTRDPADDVWKGTYTSIPAGSYSYKAAIDGSWNENYGVGAVPNGANISVVVPAAPVSFYYDHGTHWITSDANGPIVTAAGSFQSELGCPADWAPDCMRSWLEDPDGDGVFTFRTDKIPAGAYEVKATHGLGWTENYGAGGAPGGANIAFTVPTNDSIVTFTYTLSTHELTVSSARAAGVPDLSVVKATWVAPNLIAWPASSVPPVDVNALRWRLHWSATGGLGLDVEAVTGGSTAGLRLVPGGLPASVLAAHPELAGAVALRIPNSALAPARAALASGQVVVGLYDDAGLLLDAGAVAAG